jgi:uncharacterized repeat protein (TIGR01451 family)
MKTFHINRLAPPTRGGDESRLRRGRYAALAVVVAALATLLAANLNGPARANDEIVQTFASDCVTPRTTFYLGDTVCAVVSGAVVDSEAVYRRLQWASPDITEGQRVDISRESQVDTFQIPTSGPLAQVGSWTVQTIDPSANGYATAKFVVRDRFRPVVNLAIVKDGPDRIVAGDRFLEYTVKITNLGPETAKEIKFLDSVPRGTMLYKMGQTSGRTATCEPAREPGASTTCYIEGMREGETASFIFIYQLDDFLRVGTVFSSAAEVYSAIDELDKRDNFASAETTLVAKEDDAPPPIDN